ncbi:hypothetical protein NPX13_g5915 [Xylaria arbuscula]|uniref:Uncharacterized protein n=1 Tax=Xylaria arbuscula TaxID=114810 RepID=A0A9W8NDG9_9PEZI|nr:hypothetical protein NPX13_g5915 [Xylaria arbuscula]
MPTSLGNKGLLDTLASQTNASSDLPVTYVPERNMLKMANVLAWVDSVSTAQDKNGGFRERLAAYAASHVTAGLCAMVFAGGLGNLGPSQTGAFVRGPHKAVIGVAYGFLGAPIALRTMVQAPPRDASGQSVAV